MYLMRWLRGVTALAEGLVVTLTLGIITPPWLRAVDDAYLEACEDAFNAMTTKTNLKEE